MKTALIHSHAQDAEHIDIKPQEASKPTISKEQILVNVKASGINASDALAAMGYFNHAKTPRIPGRDFAGTIVEGPEALIGKNIWGTGGAAGIDFDGTHAEFIVLPLEAVSEMPSNLSFEEAGGVTLPYVTAYYALVERSHLSKGKSCLVIGALGQVGHAAMEIASWLGAHPVAVVRGKEELEKAQSLGLKAVDSTDEGFEQAAKQLNGGKGFDTVLNTVGTILWKPIISILAEEGHLATISAPPSHRLAEVNLFELYRANQTLAGVNTVPLSYAKNAELLNKMKPGFESGALTPPKADEMLCFTLDKASDAYKAVLNPNIRERIILKF